MKERIVCLVYHDLFFVRKDKEKEDRYMFYWSSSKMSDLFSAWRQDPRYTKQGIKNIPGRINLGGFTKKEIINTLSYFRESGLELSLETEIWIANNNM